MHPLEERIIAGKELAVRLTQDTEPEISWFVDALQVHYHHLTGEPTSLMVSAHSRSAHYYYLPPASFGDPSVEEIASRFIEWIRSAMEREFLVADDPPMGGGPYPPNTSLRAMMQARLVELYGSADHPAVLAAQRRRTEREKRQAEQEKREAEKGEKRRGPSGALSWITTFTYDREGRLK